VCTLNTLPTGTIFVVPKGVQAIVPVREWWLDTARELIRNDERSLQRLGEDLARWIPGKRRFDHGQLSRFKEGKVGATFELIIALCEEYEALAQPIFFARSPAEAIELSGVARKYDPPKDKGGAAHGRLADIISFEGRAAQKRRAG
jgi:hypothetical protein